VDIVELAALKRAPHVELLAYRNPRGSAAPSWHSADIAASRLVFAVDGLAEHLDRVVLEDGTSAALMHDPDGHALLLLQRGTTSGRLIPSP
jgi:hypothetical protein